MAKCNIKAINKELITTAHELESPSTNNLTIPIWSNVVITNICSLDGKIKVFIKFDNIYYGWDNINKFRIKW